MIDIPDSIFPLNDQGQPICPRCKKVVVSCTCPAGEPVRPKSAETKNSGSIFSDVYIRLEKSGRGGKAVTVIRRLPSDEKFLSALARELKMKTGSGGTHYQSDDGGTIEIQGDKQKELREFFGKKRQEGLFRDPRAGSLQIRK